MRREAAVIFERRRHTIDSLTGVGPSGTNLFRLRVRGTDRGEFQQRLAARGVLLPSPQNDAFLVGVNETLNRTTAPELTSAFTSALAESEPLSLAIMVNANGERQTTNPERRTTIRSSP